MDYYETFQNPDNIAQEIARTQKHQDQALEDFIDAAREVNNTGSLPSEDTISDHPDWHTEQGPQDMFSASAVFAALKDRLTLLNQLQDATRKRGPMSRKAKKLVTKLRTHDTEHNLPQTPPEHV